MSNQTKILFILGGHDLEMITIRELLLENGFVEVHHPEELVHPKMFCDKGLSWQNATWDQYREVIENAGVDQIFGVELRDSKKFTRPKNSILIDHHNDLPPTPTSLEQVALLINASVKDRKFQLVIHNDLGSKNGLKRFGASLMEIKDIRQREREILGITDKHMDVAEQNLQNAKKNEDVLIVKTKLSSFTPVTDLTNHEKLIVYNEVSLCYFGYGAQSLLKEHFKDWRKEYPNDLFFGGEQDGFMGVTESGLLRKIVEYWIEEIVVVVYAKSTHSFMLPLKWDFCYNLSEEKEPDFLMDRMFDERTGLDDFHRLLKQGTDHKWERKVFRINNPSDYNEVVYFHEHVHKVLYDYDLPNEGKRFSDKRVMLFYETGEHFEDYYEIQTEKDSYNLRLRSVTLHECFYRDKMRDVNEEEEYIKTCGMEEAKVSFIFQKEGQPKAFHIDVVTDFKYSHSASSDPKSGKVVFSMKTFPGDTVRDIFIRDTVKNSREDPVTGAFALNNEEPHTILV